MYRFIISSSCSSNHCTLMKLSNKSVLSPVSPFFQSSKVGVSTIIINLNAELFRLSGPLWSMRLNCEKVKLNSRDWFKKWSQRLKEKQKTLCSFALRYIVYMGNTFSFIYSIFREMVSIIISGCTRTRTHMDTCQTKTLNRRLVIHLLFWHASQEELVLTADLQFACLAVLFSLNYCFPFTCCS